MAGVISVLQEISGHFCNEMGRFQAEISSTICNHTGKTSFAGYRIPLTDYKMGLKFLVISPLIRSQVISGLAETRILCSTVNRVLRTLPVNHASNDVSIDEPAPRPRRWFDDALDRQPRHCPRCGSDAIVPTFDADGDIWECAELACGYVWEPER